LTEIFDLDEMIKKAMNREKLSYELYSGWEGRFFEEAANKAIKMLAREEEGHVKLMEMCLQDHNMDRLGRKEPKRPGPAPRVPDVDVITENCTAKELIAYAIHHEDRAIHYYSRYMDIFKDTPLFNFFSHMKLEEEKHKERLESIFLREYAGRKG
jgi:rubrerythrin